MIPHGVGEVPAHTVEEFAHPAAATRGVPQTSGSSLGRCMGLSAERTQHPQLGTAAVPPIPRLQFVPAGGSRLTVGVNGGQGSRCSNQVGRGVGPGPVSPR